MQRSLNSRRRYAVGAVVAGTLIAAFGGTDQPDPYHDMLSPERPECPHAYDTIVVRVTGKAHETSATSMQMVFPNGLAVPGPTTNIPEFHDCQAVIIGRGRSAYYGPLMAVFAADSLDARVQLAPLAAHALPQSIRAAAEVFVYSDVYSYQPLGLGPLFNCLYVWGTERNPQAKMVKVGREEATCDNTVNPEDLAGTELRVIRRVEGTLTYPTDYPKAARWDRDPGSGKMYIGLRCGSAWCEIGEKGFLFGNFSRSPEYRQAPGSGSSIPPGEARVMAIKGWYDQQYLALPEAVRNADGTVPRDAAGRPLQRWVPSNIRGTLIPHPDLSTYSAGSYAGTWKDVAYLVTSAPAPYYKQKFNIDDAPDGTDLARLSRLAYCYGTRTQCTLPTGGRPYDQLVARCTAARVASPNPQWWGRVRSAKDGTTLYTCITRRDHAAAATMYNIPFPHTARWRWMVNDETSWTECETGCCEMVGCDNC